MTGKGSTWLGVLYDFVEMVRLLKSFEASQETNDEEEGESNE